MKTIKIIIAIILSNLLSPVYGQEVEYDKLDSLTMKFVSELQSENIDTICVYLDYSIGGIYLQDKNNPCTHRSNIFIPTYILWISNGKTFLHKKDNCFDYKTIEIDAQSMWDIFLKHQLEISKEKVKIFESKRTKRKSTIHITSTPYIREFVVFIKGSEFVRMIFTDTDLEKETGVYQNINYLHNQNLKGLILVNKLEELIKGVEKDSLLIRDGWVR